MLLIETFSGKGTGTSLSEIRTDLLPVLENVEVRLVGDVEGGFVDALGSLIVWPVERLPHFASCESTLLCAFVLTSC